MLRSKLAALAITVLAAAGLAAAGAATATPASAVTWNDTSFQAHPPFSVASIALGAPVQVTAKHFTSPITCLGIDTSTLEAHSSAASATATITGSGCGTLDVVYTGTGNPAGTFTFTVSGSPSPSGHGATDVAVLVADADHSTVVTYGMTMTPPPNTVYPDVQFSGKELISCYGFHTASLAASPCVTSGSTDLDTKTVNNAFSVHAVNPASGVAASGQSITASGSSLAPGTYAYATVEGSADSAVASETFSLDVAADQVPVVVPPGDLGDFVNAYGNGLDVFRQHYAAGAIVAGWTATQSDPATLWIRHDTGLTIGGNTVYTVEATRSGGHATGLCLSNPMGGWSDPAGPTGLLIVHCAGNPQANKFQQFYLDGGTHHLISVINGQAVSPHGTGAQLTASGVAPWPGGSDYRWMDKASLPG